MTERRRIQRFEILAVLGDGGMGTVFHARDPQLERDVAIKVLKDISQHARSALSTDHTLDLRGRGGPRKRDDLLQEARLMARLSHPNVVPIFEVGLDEAGDVFVVMEYVAGEDLRQWLKTERSIVEIARVAAQAARGLAAAHDRGIVHRDFKPDNVLIGSDGRARVTDFGISKLGEPTGLVMTAKVAGTPRYMAPELWNGAPATQASDVFALCTTIAEAFGDRASEPVQALIERGLAKRPADRPSVGAIIAMLEGHTPRRRTAIVAAAVLGIAAIGTGVAFAMQTDADASCDVDPSLLAHRWDADKRAAVRASMTGTASDLDRLLGIVDRRANEIATLSRAGCKAAHAKQLTEAQAQQRAACLELRAIELGAIADRQIAAKSPFTRAEIRFHRASPAISCDDVATPTRDPAALAPLYSKLYAALDDTPGDPFDDLEPLADAARTAGDPELAVKVLVLLGSRQRSTDRAGEADETFQRAYREAMAIDSSDGATLAIGERLLTVVNSKDIVQTKTLGALGLDVANKPTTSVRARLRLLRAVERTTGARGDHRAAVALAREALALAAQGDERNHDVGMLLRLDLAEAMLLLNERIPEAIEIAKEAVELARVQGERTNNYAVAMNVLAKAYTQANQLDHALENRRRALGVWNQIHPPTHSSVIEGRVELAVSLMRASRFEESHRELVDAVALAAKSENCRRIYPWMLTRLAKVKSELGHGEEAVRLFEEAIELLASTVGADHPQTLWQRYNLGVLLFELGRVDEAQRIVELLDQSLSRKHEPGDRLPALIRGALAADIALARKRPGDAETLARSAVEELTELGSTEELAIAQNHLGDALVAQGRFAAAMPLLETAFASAKSQNMRADELAYYEVSIALAERGLGKHAEARARAERLAQVLESYPAARTARANVERLLKR